MVVEYYSGYPYQVPAIQSVFNAMHTKIKVSKAVLLAIVCR